MTATIAALRAGKIIAVKGIEGCHHLICDAAQNDNSLLRLQE
ncbi:MAG: hypothetical protein R3E08_01260 [Thiotrichaceae bacterium]